MGHPFSFSSDGHDDDDDDDDDHEDDDDEHVEIDDGGVGAQNLLLSHEVICTVNT